MIDYLLYSAGLVAWIFVLALIVWMIAESIMTTVAVCSMARAMRAVAQAHGWQIEWRLFARWFVREWVDTWPYREGMLTLYLGGGVWHGIGAWHVYPKDSK